MVITGGSGYVGENLLLELDRRGTSYVNIDIQNGQDITDLSSMFEMTKESEVIIHLAADPDVQESIYEPIKTNRTNVTGTLNMLECARRHDSTFIFISSFASMDIKSPYGLQKRMGEEYCRIFSDLYGIKCLVLRFSNLYGGSNYITNKESVIAVFVKQLIESKPLTVFGGNQTRDFVHVDDVVVGILGSLESSKDFEIYDIASGIEISIRDLAEMFQSLKPGLEIHYLDYLKGEVMKSVGNISLAQEDFGYNPQKDIREGIAYLVEMTE